MYIVSRIFKDMNPKLSQNDPWVVWTNLSKNGHRVVLIQHLWYM